MIMSLGVTTLRGCPVNSGRRQRVRRAAAPAWRAAPGDNGTHGLAAPQRWEVLLFRRRSAMTRTPWALCLAVFLAWLLTAGPALAVFPPPIKDDGKFFTREGLEKANKKIKEIYQK